MDFPDIKYPVLTLCDLAIQYKRIDKLEYAIGILEKLIHLNLKHTAVL